jgi:hypothetical protein
MVSRWFGLVLKIKGILKKLRRENSCGAIDMSKVVLKNMNRKICGQHAVKNLPGPTTI